MTLTKIGQTFFGGIIPGLGNPEGCPKVKVFACANNNKTGGFEKKIKRLSKTTLFARCATVIGVTSAFVAYKMNTVSLSFLAPVAGKFFGTVAPKWLFSLFALKAGSVAAFVLSFAYLFALGILACVATRIFSQCLYLLIAFLNNLSADGNSCFKECVIRFFLCICLLIDLIMILPSHVMLLNIIGIPTHFELVWRRFSDIFATSPTKSLMHWGFEIQKE